jgi:hypothetical protein
MGIVTNTKDKQMIKNLLLGTAAGAVLALSLWANAAKADNYKEGRMYECTQMANAYIEVTKIRDLGVPLEQLLVVLEDYPAAWTAIALVIYKTKGGNPEQWGKAAYNVCMSEPV